ncbi:hypothetical protein DAPPUDRAFT_237382 [Daphnia pulex]|uniref:Uncharacterized protein n=1 Tax=Daphnia pulex TaxID=6669 RepID=E9G3S6_DAPPU|nr:hypothetical protein DAPPUDRAFT_237382 [Daphnia pulex]|eukprot:EFX85821.1 hypothetical protein DAPPUDRAFT_237382 [Daphnia pulex]
MSSHRKLKATAEERPAAKSLSAPNQKSSSQSVISVSQNNKFPGVSSIRIDLKDTRLGNIAALAAV